MLLCKPRLLLLDEVTSQLDAENERALKETVRRVSLRCAVLVIAHRLSTIVQAERILLLDGGRVSAEGTHEELLKNSPLYKRLVETQMIEAEYLSFGGRLRRALALIGSAPHRSRRSRQPNGRRLIGPAKRGRAF